MTAARTADGGVVHFPASLATDPRGVIIPTPAEDLPAIAERIAEVDLGIFTRRLLRNAHKRRRQPRYAEVNRTRLELARLCIERALSEPAGPALI